ncbi:MAG: M23 family metallopeptidase [Myxococcota bacterium]
MLIGLLAMIGASIHGVLQRSVAEDSYRIAHENLALKKMVKTLESRLPEAQLVAVRAELTFAQLFAKSGLGRDLNLLGAGPIDSDGVNQVAPGFSGRLLDLEPMDVPLEFDRLYLDGQRLQRSLAELAEYFNDAERLLDNTPSINPAPTPWLTSTFGIRNHPVTGQRLMHKGIDIGGQIGDEVVAPADAAVIFVGRRGGYGQTVVLDHGYGLQTHFAHLSAYRVEIGDHVKRGDIIALMGSTGKSTGPHLHYEVRRMGQPLNPLAFVLDQRHWPAR